MAIDGKIFMVHPVIHLLFRGCAVIMALIIIYLAAEHRTDLLLAIGVATLIVDGYLFFKTIQWLKVMSETGEDPMCKYNNRVAL